MIMKTKLLRFACELKAAERVCAMIGVNGQDYESDFEEDEEEETSGASSTQDEQQPQQSEHKPREMVSLPEPPAKPISALSRSNDQKRTKVARRESRGESPVEETRPRGLGEEENGVASEMKAIAPVIGEKATIAKKAALSKSFPQQQQEQKRQLKENNNAGQSGQQAAVSAAPLPEDRDNQAPIHTLATQQIKMLKMMRLDVVSCGAVDISPTTLATTKQNNAKSASDETKSSCEEKWTQHPAMQNDEEVGGGSSSAAEQQVEVSEKVAAALKRASDKVELSELLREKSHFFERAVENVGLGGEVRNLAKEGTKFAARSGAINSRPPKMLHFAEPARLISVHAWQEGDESAGELLFVWTILADTEHPFYVLGCRGRVTCICVPSTAPSLVLAGTQDGTVCLWDLQEPASNHSTMLLGSQTLVVRSSAFTTALLKSSHVFAVRGLCSVAGGEQVASVDQEGEMAVWSVVWASGGHPDSVERGCHLVRGAQRNLRAELADGESAEVTDVVSSAERLLVAFDTALVVAFSPLSSVGRIKKYPPTRGPILGETMLAINPRLKNTFAVLDGFGDVSVFDAKHSRPLWRLAAHAAILSWASSGLLLLHADRTRLSLWSPPTVTGEQTATHLASCQLHSKVDQVTASISTDNVVLTTCDGELVSISIRRDLSAASARK
ncbi:Hypothetical predicted protein [Cloeon dipterum]|uniref:Uncharacterized protein n=1 Tax=Cloeon dipterum TaxID=197152 RepID=A0A8S1C2Y1_9INSE|nr:Hypothetical predicted protein [Cloeon dipterum]